MNILQYFNELFRFTPQNLSECQQFLFLLMVLAIIALWCIIDILGYLCSSYFIKYSDAENKYPKLKRLINYNFKANYVFIIFQIIYIVVIYVYIIGICAAVLYLK
jgi:heme/copper-type cytochrome/quinol oxidase subunit 2